MVHYSLEVLAMSKMILIIEDETIMTGTRGLQNSSTKF